ncbi:MAG: CHAD domain-containing protein [Caulobacteraceae bacterium]|nr:CHAD domain-containing protein [Caulobacteraceae bacterium]
MRPPDTEVELKLAIGSASARRAAEREVGAARPRTLESIYYDTGDHRLRAAGYCLRVRREAGKWSQAVKGGAGLARYENERLIKSAAPVFALLDSTPAAGLIGAAEDLRPIFRVKVERRSRIRKVGLSRIELSLDEGELAALDRTWPILELELELKSGRPCDIFAEARRLAGAEALVPAFASKAERGHALRDGALGEPAKVHFPPFDRELSAGGAFQAIGRACLEHLALNADLIRSGQRIEATHQARVALRRLRVALTVFKPFLAGDRRESLKGELVWLTGELEGARNLDVFAFEAFRPAARTLADPAPMAALGQALLGAQQAAHARAASAVDGARYRRLLIDAADWIETADWSGDALTGREAEGPARQFARSALDRRRKALGKRVKTLNWKDPLARHKLRIEAKKMRYASEFFAGLADGRRARRRLAFTDVLETLQTSLGRLNDIWVGQRTALAALNRLGERRDADGAGFAAGVVVGQDLARAAPLIKAAKRESRAFAKTVDWW